MKTHELMKEIILTEKHIINTIKEKSSIINEHYKGKEKPIVIGILKGCVLFMSHLVPNLDFDIDIDFMTIKRTKGSIILDTFDLVWDTSLNLEGRNVLVVEDVIDTGVTLFKIKKILLSRGVKEFKSVALIDKPKNRKVDFQPDWKFIEIDTKEWLMGWGFDMDNVHRNYPYIGFLKDDLKG